MTKWDTIQADVTDMYIGQDELESWESVYREDMALGFDDDNDDTDLTLDWDN